MCYDTHGMLRLLIELYNHSWENSLKKNFKHFTTLNITCECCVLKSGHFIGEIVKSIKGLGLGFFHIFSTQKKTELLLVLVILIPYVSAFTHRCFITGLLPRAAGKFMSQTSKHSLLPVWSWDAVDHWNISCFKCRWYSKPKD